MSSGCQDLLQDYRNELTRYKEGLEDLIQKLKNLYDMTRANLLTIDDTRTFIEGAYDKLSKCGRETGKLGYCYEQTIKLHDYGQPTLYLKQLAFYLDKLHDAGFNLTFKNYIRDMRKYFGYGAAVEDLREHLDIWDGVKSDLISKKDDCIKVCKDYNINEDFYFWMDKIKEMEMKSLVDKLEGGIDSLEKVAVKPYVRGAAGIKIETELNIQVGHMFPQDVEVVQWGFKAPSNELLGGMEGSCPLSFKISYVFDAQTVADVTFISKTRLEEETRAGRRTLVTPIETKARGPVKIDVEFGLNQPIRSGLMVPVIFRIQDRGSGMLESIPASALKLETNIPDFDLDDCPKLKEMDEIPMIRRESPPIRCSFRAPDVTDLRTFYIKVWIEDYTYNLYGGETVTITPTLII